MVHEKPLGRSFLEAMIDADFREQYFDTVHSAIRDQERAGLIVVSDGGTRFDDGIQACWMGYTYLSVLGGLTGRESQITPSFPGGSGSVPGDILFEIQGCIVRRELGLRQIRAEEGRGCMAGSDKAQGFTCESGRSLI